MDDHDDDQYGFDWDAKEEHGLARNSDPETSHEAGESLDAEAITRLQGIILDALVEYTDRSYQGHLYPCGLTAHEIAFVTGLALNTISTRMKKMRERNLILWSGEKRTWHGSPGNPATTRLSMIYQLPSYNPGHGATPVALPQAHSPQTEKPAEIGVRSSWPTRLSHGHSRSRSSR